MVIKLYLPLFIVAEQIQIMAGLGLHTDAIV